MGGSSLIFGPEKGSEKVEIPVESVAIPVDGKPKKDGDRTSGVGGGIFNDGDDDVLQQLKKVNCETGHVEGSGAAVHKSPKMGFENALNPVVKVEKVDVLEKRLEWNHQVVTSLLWELLDVVPTTKLLGEQCGFDIQWLQGERNGLEIDLQNVRDAQKQRVVKMPFKRMMGCLRVRGRSCKPPQFLLVKSEMNLVNGKSPWKRIQGFGS